MNRVGPWTAFSLGVLLSGLGPFLLLGAHLLQPSGSLPAERLRDDVAAIVSGCSRIDVGRVVVDDDGRGHWSVWTKGLEDSGNVGSNQSHAANNSQDDQKGSERIMTAKLLYGCS